MFERLGGLSSRTAKREGGDLVCPAVSGEVWAGESVLDGKE